MIHQAVDIDLKKIKQKIEKIDHTRYWGDDFDVRFYLITKIKKLKNKTILDVGGGIGIISSELDKSNFIINLDLSWNDLKTSNLHFKEKMENICASMEYLPFQQNVFDNVLCAHILEIAKAKDLNQINENIDFPTANNILKEIYMCMKSNSILFLTTPNNSYYKSNKLTYSELKNMIKKIFSNFSINFYNTYPRLSRKYRKLNLANIVPKLKLKFQNHNSIINSLIKQDENHEISSVSFYVEAIKS